jgi:cytochrome c
MTVDVWHTETLRLAAAALLTFGLATAARAQDDLVAEGEGVFRRCAACHAIGEGAENRVGPQLNQVYGRVAGSLEDFEYSDAMKAAGEAGLVWDEAQLSAFLANPREHVPGTKMAFAGLRKEEEIAAVIAYLRDAGGVAEGFEEGGEGG